MKTTIFLFTCSVSFAMADGPFDRLKQRFTDRYIPQVGLALYDSDSGGSNGFWGKCNVYALPTRSILEAGIKGGNRRLFMPDMLDGDQGDGSQTFKRTILTMRIQDTLDKFGKDAGSATLSYSTGDMEDLTLSGAVLFDLYAPSDFLLGGYQTGDKGFGFHLRAGAQVNRAFKDRSGGGVDHREYFLGFNILAPIITDEGLRAAAASTMDFGYHIKENRITGESTDSLVLKWRPAFRQVFGFDIATKNLPDDFGALFQKTKPNPTISSVNEVEKEDDPRAASQVGNMAGIQRFSLQPRFEIEQILEHASGREDGFCSCAGIDFRFITLDDQLTFTYSYDLAYSFDQSESYSFNKLGLDFKLDTVIEDLSLSLSYIQGRRAPDFVEEELFKAGFGLQF